MAFLTFGATKRDRSNLCALSVSAHIAAMTIEFNQPQTIELGRYAEEQMAEVDHVCKVTSFFSDQEGIPEGFARIYYDWETFGRDEFEPKIVSFLHSAVIYLKAIRTVEVQLKPVTK